MDFLWLRWGGSGIIKGTNSQFSSTAIDHAEVHHFQTRESFLAEEQDAERVPQESTHNG
jgi:hypothetical protein